MSPGTEPHAAAQRLRRELADDALVERATGVVMEQTSGTAAEARRKLARDAAAAGRTLLRQCAAVLADAVQPPSPPVGADLPPVRHRLVTVDPEHALSELAAAYRTPVRMTTPGPSGGRFRLEHTDAGPFQTGEQQLPGSLSFVSEPAAQVVVAELLTGTLQQDTRSGEQRMAATDVFLTGRPAMAHTTATQDARVHTVTLPLPLLHKVAGHLPDQARPLDFTGLRATSPELAAQWHATAAYTAALLDRPDHATGLVMDSAAQLLAATALAVFPNSVTAFPAASHEWTDATPLTVRRAAAFMEEHADQDVTLADIAAAAYVTPRALQYAFRRHLGTTPLGYLRDLRLRRAHRDLMDADPALTTVTQVAARWGFLHPGRFATRYQHLYHCSPSATLQS